MCDPPFIIEFTFDVNDLIVLWRKLNIKRGSQLFLTVSNIFKLAQKRELLGNLEGKVSFGKYQIYIDSRNSTVLQNIILDQYTY